MGGVNQGMLDIAWFEALLKIWSVWLQSLPEGWIKHILIVTRVDWITKWMEWATTLHLQIVESRHGLVGSVPRLDYAVGRVREMVWLIDQIIFAKELIWDGRRYVTAVFPNAIVCGKNRFSRPSPFGLCDICTIRIYVIWVPLRKICPVLHGIILFWNNLLPQFRIIVVAQVICHFISCHNI